MGPSRIRRRVAAVALLPYLALYGLNHVDEPTGGPNALAQTVFVVGIAAPIVAVVLASQEWPRPWLPLAVLTGFFLLPYAVWIVEWLLHWYPAGDGPADYDDALLRNTGTRFLSVLAWPLAVFAGIGVMVARARRGRHRRSGALRSDA